MSHQNLLSSTIPSSFIELHKLETFLVNSNTAITGPMDTFCESTSIRIFNADCTNFTDSQCSCCTTCCDHDDDTTATMLTSSNTNGDAQNHHNIAHAYCDGTTFFSGLDPTISSHANHNLFM